jgi:hypothetical protein
LVEDSNAIVVDSTDCVQQPAREEVPTASREDDPCECAFDYQLPELYANDSAETLQDITNPARAHVGSIEPCPDEENLGSGVTDIVINDELPIQAEVVSVSFIVAMKTLFFYTLH